MNLFKNVGIKETRSRTLYIDGLKSGSYVISAVFLRVGYTDLDTFENVNLMSIRVIDKFLFHFKLTNPH